MKKLNSKGFTLIELLAVIIIMGTLMAVAVGSVSKITENSKKDTFAGTALSYLEAVRNAVIADNVECTVNGQATSASALPQGWYYVYIDTVDNKGNAQKLMEKVGKSSYGNSDLAGYVAFGVGMTSDAPHYYVALTDRTGHGIPHFKSEAELKRDNIEENVSQLAGYNGTTISTAYSSSSLSNAYSSKGLDYNKITKCTVKS